MPRDLDLSIFRGARLDRIDLGAYIVYFRFSDPTAEISVEGDWELRDADGALIDQQMEPAARKAYRLHVQLGREVVGGEVAAPESFSLRFNSGHVLRILDRNPHYESFSIQPGNIYV